MGSDPFGIQALVQPIKDAAPIIVAVVVAIFSLYGLLIAFLYSRKAARVAEERRNKAHHEELRFRIEEARARLLEIQVEKEEKLLKSENSDDDFSDCPDAANDEVSNLEDEENELQSEINAANDELFFGDDESDDWRC